MSVKNKTLIKQLNINHLNDNLNFIKLIDKKHN